MIAGVRSKTVRIGFPYIDFNALHALGVKLTHGSFPEAYNAVFANLNSFFSSRRRHTSLTCDWSSDVCSSDLAVLVVDEHVSARVDGRRPRVGGVARQNGYRVARDPAHRHVLDLAARRGHQDTPGHDAVATNVEGRRCLRVPRPEKPEAASRPLPGAAARQRRGGSRFGGL